MRIIVKLLLIGLIFQACDSKVLKQDELITLDSLKSEKLRITFISDTNEVKWLIDSSIAFWIPTQSNMNLIDTILLEAIIEDNGRNFLRTNVNSYKEYYRQYVCFVKDNGDSMVYINALCRIFEGPIHDDKDSLRWGRYDWQHHLIEVEDGGPCFWRIWINLTKREYFNFMVNGFA